MNADYNFKFSQQSDTGRTEFEFNLSKSDYAEQKSEFSE